MKDDVTTMAPTDPTERIRLMLDRCTSDVAPFPPTDLYNETWLLRLILDWFSTHSVPGHPLDFPKDGRWFSEARLPSAFLARCRGDRLAEAWTHADGVIGHFEIGSGGKADLSLSSGASHFVVVEAKMFSRLSSGTTHARYYDQAVRSVACIAEVLRRAHSDPEAVSPLAFYLLAPRQQIDSGIFANEMDEDSIRQKVTQRVSEYEGEKDEWFATCFSAVSGQIAIDLLSWEEIIEAIEAQDARSAEALMGFYKHCLRFNWPGKGRPST